MRRLAGVADDPEHVVGGQIEDRQPVKPFPAGAGVSVAAPPGGAFGPRIALVAPDSDGGDDAPAEAGVGLQVAAKLSFDRSSLMFAGTIPELWSRKPAPFLDAFQKRLAGRHAREYQRNARGHGVLDVLDRAWPLDLSERSMDHHELVAGHGPGEQDGHGLAILAP